MQKKGHHVRTPQMSSFSDKNGVYSKKDAIAFADVQFSAQNRVKIKNKDHHVRRCPIFRPKSGEEQKKVITSAGKIFQSTSGSLKCTSGSLSDPWVSGSPS